MKPIILAGGVGSRLWPKSRAARPKQFLSLTSPATMLQQTIARLDGLNSLVPAVVCNNEHRFLVAEQLRESGVSGSEIILEPEGKNTAPAIALAAFQAVANDDDPVLLVLAADHVIKDSDAFQQAVTSAKPLAEAGKLVTFGVVPTQPHTGYGYIKAGRQVANGFEVAAFTEKPNKEIAEAYLNSGHYYWNSGMFMFRASCYLEVLKACQRDMFDMCERAVAAQTTDLDFIRVDPAIFSQCPSNSIDYAVMEKTDAGVMVPLDAGWSDVGSWSSLWEVSDKDRQGNVQTGDTVLENVRNSYVNAEERLVAVAGLDDVIVVETRDAVMVANRQDSDALMNMVSKLKAEHRSEFDNHRQVYRPWGSYDAIDGGERFQVKRITVKPGEKLSVQLHHHRAEHWVVVSGTAKVTIGEKTRLITENESVYIPVGVVHALENPGKIPLDLIEVQTGAYFGEDDIVRLFDHYGRRQEGE